MQYAARGPRFTGSATTTIGFPYSRASSFDGYTPGKSNLTSFE
jgi:hypothetical protein